jgi:hypothetical protein
MVPGVELSGALMRWAGLFALAPRTDRLLVARSIVSGGATPSGRLTLIADDRPGLLAAVAGTLAAHGIDILAAELFPLGPDRVLDTFLVREPGQRPPSADRIARARADLERVLASFKGLLVVDEAYAPFATENAVPLLARYPNLVIVRTLSKAHALAGIRVGYSLSHPAVTAVLDRVRDSYNVSRLSQAAALAAITDEAYYAGIIGRVKATRDHSIAGFAARGWFTYPSQSNFIFTEPRNARGERGPAVAKSAYDFLYAHKVLIRYFPSHALTAPFLRISVGTVCEMQVLSETLDAWLKSPNA